MPDPLVLATLITAASAVIATIINRYRPGKNGRIAEFEAALRDTQMTLERMKGRQEAEKEIRELNLIRAVHSPHLKPLDALLSKVKTDIENRTDTVTLNELREARDRLRDEMQKIADRDEPNADVARIGWRDLLTMIEIRILDREGNDGIF